MELIKIFLLLQLGIIVNLTTAKMCTKITLHIVPEKILLSNNKWLEKNKTTTKLENYCCEKYYKGKNNECVPICKHFCPNGICVEPYNCKCNPGYKLNNFTEKCEPVCVNNCQNGKCLAPEKCECNLGYKFNNSTKKCEILTLSDNNSKHLDAKLSLRIKSNGSAECGKGKCLASGKCECNTGYTFNNSTKKCELNSLSNNNTNKHSVASFLSELNKNCLTKCENAKCLPSGKWECNSGYKFNNTTKKCELNLKNETNSKHFVAKLSDELKSNCSTKCENGKCLASGKCECNSGYKLNNSTKKCELNSLTNSKLKAFVVNLSNEPKHFVTYIFEDVKSNCTTKCENGKCLASGKCECSSQYKFNNFTKKCELKSVIDKNSKIFVTNLSSDLNSNCSIKCENGKCLASGNKFNNSTKKCELKSVTDNNSKIFVAKLSSDLKSNCSTKCENLKCLASGKCECNSRYKFNNSTKKCELKSVTDNNSKIFVSSLSSDSKSNCSTKCENGKCLASGKCECNSGYKFNNFNQKCELNSVTAYDSKIVVANLSSDLKTNCSTKCENVQCLVSGKCECNLGYKFNNTTKKCELNLITESNSKHFVAKLSNDLKSNCSTKCENGKYLALGKCECNSGYKFNNSTKKCELNSLAHNNSKHNNLNPLIELQNNCSTKCENGKCLASGKCECNSGYKLNNSTNICEAICRLRCGHGTCISSEKCKCNPGYKFDTILKTCLRVDYKNPKGILKPFPTNKFINSLFCENGFKYNETSHICQPICHTDCLNGNCTAPNICSCNNGYSLDVTNGSCVENLCSLPCTNGYCLATDECVCNSGYTRSIIVLGPPHCERLYLYIIKVVACVSVGIVFVGIVVLLLIRFLVVEDMYRVKNKTKNVQPEK